MMSKNNAASAFGAFLATMYAALLAVMIHDHWPALHVAVLLLIFITLWAGFFLAGIWVFLYRPAELTRNFQLAAKNSAKEKENLYEWLGSQGRRRS